MRLIPLRGLTGGEGTPLRLASTSPGSMSDRRVPSAAPASSSLSAGDQERLGSERDMVTRTDELWLGESPAVDSCSVCRAEVREQPPIAREVQPGVIARDGRISDEQVTVLRPTEKVRVRSFSRERQAVLVRRVPGKSHPEDEPRHGRGHSHCWVSKPGVSREVADEIGKFASAPAPEGFIDAPGECVGGQPSLRRCIAQQAEHPVAFRI